MEKETSESASATSRSFGKSVAAGWASSTRHNSFPSIAGWRSRSSRGSLGLSSTAVLRFQREAEAAGRLHHTHIVPIYSTGSDGGTHYYAMELIDGPSLHEVIRGAAFRPGGQGRGERLGRDDRRRPGAAAARGRLPVRIVRWSDRDAHVGCRDAEFFSDVGGNGPGSRQAVGDEL